MTTPRVTVPEAKVYIDCEFDGHGGPLLSMALVRDDGRSIYLCVPDAPMTLTSWVKENVWPLVHMSLPVGRTVAFVNDWGPLVRSFLGNEAPIIIADSPVDIGRFCAVLSTGADGGWASTDYPRVTCEVHNVDCYPTGLPGAVQHNAWWDAMALREALRPLISAAPAPEGGAVSERLAEIATWTDEEWETVFAHRPDLRDRMRATLATREEAPAEAGEVDAGVIQRLNDLAALLEGLAASARRDAGQKDATASGAAAMTGYLFAAVANEGAAEKVRAIVAALRAQPQAREEAQPVADAVEPIERAIAALKRHISAIQAAKQGGGSSSPITDCINGLPGIVRWIESGLFNVEAAFEHYEATPPAPEAEKLRAVEALEAIEKIRSEMVMVPIDSEAANAWANALGRAADMAAEALAALQAEQGAT